MRFLFTALVVLYTANLSLQAGVKLSVFYESLCPDSRRFIIEQLYPTLTLLGGIDNPYFETDFVPYGKATTEFIDGSYVFECQHGNDECLGNKIHACALAKMLRNESAAFIDCMMDSFDAPNDAQMCADNLNIDYTRTGECYESWEGDTLLAAHGIRTHDLDPELYWVPWTMYDNVWTEEDMNGNEQDFLAVLCRKLQDKNVAMPPQCETYADLGEKVPSASSNSHSTSEGFSLNRNCGTVIVITSLILLIVELVILY